MALTQPDFLTTPFADSGLKNTIPENATGTNLASYDTGFPPITMIPLTSGGIPPEGKDFNGVLYSISSHTVWQNAGGQYVFDAALAAAIGGYSAGMVLQNNAGTASYVSATNGNVTDFNSDPSSIGVDWLPYAGRAYSSIGVVTSGGNTTLTTVQASASFITVTGVLAANATITVPAALGEWTFINNTTGDYSVTVIASGGGGVEVIQGGADRLRCDGTDVGYEAASGNTPAVGDSSVALATTEFVQTAINIVSGPTALLFYANF